MLLVQIVGMAVRNNKEVRNSQDIEEGSVSSCCKDYFVNKLGWNREVEIE